MATKITKSELKEMIREVLREELSKKPLAEALAEADFDTVTKQIKADLIREIKPTPILEDGGVFEDFTDIDLSWPQWDETNYRKDFNFQIAYDAVRNWVAKNADRYPGFSLNFLDPVAGLNDYFITINVYRE